MNAADQYWRPICSLVLRVKCPVRVWIAGEDQPRACEWSVAGLWIPVPGYLEAGGGAGPTPTRDVCWVELNDLKPRGGMFGVPASVTDVGPEIRGLRMLGVEWTLVDGSVRIWNPFSSGAQTGS